MKLALDFLLIVGILFTCLILILLIRKKTKESHHKVLIGIFVAIFLVFLNYYAYLHRIRTLFYATHFVGDSIDVFIGPILLVYIKGVIGETRNSFKNNLVHFIFPFIYLFAISIPGTLSAAFDSIEFSYLNTLENVLFNTIFYSFGYCIYSLWKLTRFQKLVKFNYSNLENKDLNWIKYLLIGSLVILGIDIVSNIFEVFSIDVGNDDGLMTVIPIVFLVTYLGYYGLAQSKILLPDFLLNPEQEDHSNLSKDKIIDLDKYTYDSSEMKLLEEVLNQLMTNEKPFLNEDLTLSTLSELLDVPDKKLSTLLNQNMNTTFYNYVNGFRVAEVKEKLSLPETEKYTLLAIAYDCGFKSKSSFNRIFKSTTQMSPSDYRKRFV